MLNAFRLIVWGGIILNVQCIFFFGHLLLLLSGQTVFCRPTSTTSFGLSFQAFYWILEFELHSFCQYQLNECVHDLQSHRFIGVARTASFGDYVKRDFNYRAHFNSSFVFTRITFHYFSALFYGWRHFFAFRSGSGILLFLFFCSRDFNHFVYSVPFVLCANIDKNPKCLRIVPLAICNGLFLLTQSIPLIKWQLITWENSPSLRCRWM